ncbi:MAG TPA: hypothetical protein VF121_05220 [Thermoanaerobaculia bacterium]|nr:hypothetical protein [Thermoanaerobaculia bacterium]
MTRHEGANRVPTLQTALGYELLFDVPLRELFTEEVGKVESIIRERLPELIRKVEEEGGDEQKLAFLRDVAKRLENYEEKHSRSADARG